MRFAPVQDARFGRSIEAAGRYNANGYKLAGAVRQFCIINALVVIHTASVFVIILAASGLPPVSRKGEFVGAIASSAGNVFHLFFNERLDLLLVQDFAGLGKFFDGRADRRRDGRCMSIGVGVVLFNFSLDQLHKCLYLRGHCKADIRFVRHSQQNVNVERKISVCATRGNLDAALVLHKEQQDLLPVVQAAENAHLMHKVGVVSALSMNADLSRGMPVVVLDGLNAKQHQFVKVATDRSFFRKVCVSRASTAHSAGNRQRAAGERFRQQGGTGGGVVRLFPTHVVCPPILIVMVSRAFAGPPAANARALIVFGPMVPGSLTEACIRAARSAPAAYAVALTARGLIVPGSRTVQEIVVPSGAAAAYAGCTSGL